MHDFPCFDSLAVQIWIFRWNSIKRTKSNSYRKHFYNCVKMEHVGLHSVGTNHKKFGWENKKIIKMYFVECPRMALGKARFAECQAWDTRYRVFKNIKTIFAECLSAGTRQRTLCRVPDRRHSTKYIFKLKNLCWVLDRRYSAKNVTLKDRATLSFHSHATTGNT
jgi:hypothetical protein